MCKLNSGLRQDCRQGTDVNQPEVAPFREKLRSAGSMPSGRKIGDEAWALLEKSVGKLS